MENSLNWVRWMRIRTFLGLLMYICLGLRAPLQGISTQSNVGEEKDDQKHSPSWTLVSKEQLSSELEEHEFTLCITALPWCGEARSLMKGIQWVLKDESSNSLSELQLFNVHASYDRNLALGTPTPPSITLYRYGIPYEYNGRRTTSAILTSIQGSIPVLRSDSVFSEIETLLELENFGDSTDKAVLLIDLCGWEKQIRHMNVHERNAATDEETRNFERVEHVLGRENSQTADSKYVIRTRGEMSPGAVEQGSNFADESHDKETRFLIHEGSRIGDEIDVVSRCFGQDTQYCVSGNSVEDFDEVSVPVPGDSSYLNVTNSVDGDELGLYNESLCSIEEYHKFKAVYQNVSRLAANSILTLVRSRFAIVRNQEVLLEAGISMQGLPWALLYHTRDLDQQPYIFDGVGDVGDFLSDHSAPLVSELDFEGHDISSSISVEVPSVILFVDRISRVPGVRAQSRDALEALRAVSYYYASQARVQRDNEDFSLNTDGVEGTLPERNEDVPATQEKTQVVEEAVDAPRWFTRPTETNLETDASSEDDDEDSLDTGSTRIGDHGLVSTSDDKEALSPRPSESIDESVAVCVPFEIDKSDMPHQVPDAAPEMEDSGSRVPTLDRRPSFSGVQVLSKKSLAVDDRKQLEGSSVLSKVSPKKSPVGTSIQFSVDRTVPERRSEATEVYSQSSNDLEALKNDVSDKDNRPPGEFEKNRENSEPKVCNPEVEQGCDGPEKNGMSKTAQDDILSQNEDEQKLAGGDWNELNFYFIDGGDYVKEKLTRSKATPALVLISPQTQAHHVFPSNDTFDASSLLRFMGAFLSGTLKRTVLSEPQQSPPRPQPRPPFVNRDFHDRNPVPRVSIDSFTKLVTGVQRTDAHSDQYVCQGHSRFTFREDSPEGFGSDAGNVTQSAWDNDVLVLFTTSWCGFCTRMELVIREVYRSLQQIKSFDMANNGSGHRAQIENNSNPDAKCIGADCSGDWSETRSGWREGKLRAMDLPVILQMDCSWNDCSEQLGDILEEENYPAVVLFPARDKFSPINYDGTPTVRGIFNFLKAHARSFGSKPGGHTFDKEAADGKAPRFPSSSGPLCDAGGRSTSIKITSSPGTRTLPESEILFLQLNSEHEDLFRRSFIGSFLIASEKLSVAATPFAKAVVLIVSMPSTNMVHGLILNKALSWKIVPGLDSRVETLLNTAAIGYGGPIIDNQRPLLILTHVKGVEEFVEVASGLYFGFLRSQGKFLEMIRSGSLRAEDFWFFFGYSSWTWHQLQNELYQDLWELREFSRDVIHWPQQWSS